MAKIIGKTFPHRDTLKALGAKWNDAGKFWTVEDTDESAIAAIRNISGVFVTADDKPGAADPFPKAVEPTEATKPIDWETIIAKIEKKIDELPAVEIEAKREGKTTFYGSSRQHYNTFAEKNPITYAGFNSFPEMLDFIEAIPTAIQRDERDNRNSAWESGSSFTGTQNMAEAIRIGREGWKKGVRMANEAMEVIHADNAVTRQRTYGVAGGRVNVGRMLSGNPMSMVSRPRRPGDKIITLYVAIGMLGMVSAENAALRAASVGAMVDLLEQSGYSCEIVGVHTTNTMTGKPGAHIAVNLKDAGEPLNLENLVFALGHPSVMRRFCFAIFAVNPDLRGMWSMMGHTVSTFKETPPNTFYIRQLEAERISGATFNDRVRRVLNVIIPKDFPVSVAG